jgi:hypothetical protein
MSVDFRFVDFNYPFKDNVAITATSEDVNFPVTNAGDPIRGRVWRSSGYFEITNSNNTIDFKESALGPELNATVATGKYSVSELETAIKNGLESGGSQIYTVAFNSNTGTWSITTDGAYLDILFSTGSNVLSSIRDDIGFSDIDYSGNTTYSGSFVALHTEERVIVDIQTTEAVDSFAVVFDPLVGINYSDEAVLKLKANHADEWTSPQVDITLSIDETYGVITHYFDEDQDYRFWCFEIVDPKNPNLYVECHTLVVGKSNTFTRIPDNGFRYRRVDESKIVRSDYNNQYVDEKLQVASIEFNFGIFEYPQAQQFWEFFARVGSKEPVFCAIDVDEDMFDKDNFYLYGRLEKNLDLRHRIINYFRSKLRITEAF